MPTQQKQGFFCFGGGVAMPKADGYAIAHRKFYKVGSSRFDFGIAKNSVLSGVLVVSKPEQPSEQDKPNEKQMIVEGLLFVFVLVPAILFVFSMIITDYLAQTPPVRSFDDAMPLEIQKLGSCESSKQNEGGDPGDCRK